MLFFTNKELITLSLIRIKTKVMKKIIVSTVFLALCALQFNYAQDHNHKRDVSVKEKNEHRLKKMETELELTQEQTKKIEAINKNYEPKEQELQEKIKKIREEKKLVKKDKHEEIKAILTPEQIEKMESLKKEKKKNKLKAKSKQRPVKRSPAPKAEPQKVDEN